MSLNFNLSAAHKKFQHHARAIFQPLLQRRLEIQRPSDRDGDYPQEVWTALTEAGFFRCFEPAAHGGNGMGVVGACLVLEELAAADAANVLPVITAMGIRALSTAAAPGLREQVLPLVMKGQLPIAFGATEPKSGYNVLRMSCLAEKKGGDRYLLNGEKAYVTGADLTPYAVIAARTTELEVSKKQGLDKTSGISLFLVRLDSPGLKRERVPRNRTGVLRRYRLQLEDVVVPAANLIGTEGAGVSTLLDAFNIERLLTAAMRIGTSRFCIEYGYRHGRDRSVFGNKSMPSYQSMQNPLAEVRVRLEASRLLLLRAAWGIDNGASPAEVGLYACAVKVLTIELAANAVDAAIDALGDRALDEQTGLARLRSAAHIGKAVPISDAMALSFIAEHALGLPRVY
jgi:alkylation response protein AidB-like acyl-CoA dehydrogenase